VLKPFTYKSPSPPPFVPINARVVEFAGALYVTVGFAGNRSAAIKPASKSPLPEYPCAPVAPVSPWSPVTPEAPV